MKKIDKLSIFLLIVAATLILDVALKGDFPFVDRGPAISSCPGGTRP